MNVPFVDLKAQYKSISDEVNLAVKEVMESCGYVMGPQVDSFEKNFAEYLKAKHAVGVASGTDALHLALRALEIGRGDEVIIPANTFIATALAVSITGAVPVLVDCEENTFLINPDKAEEAITRKTRAIIPVHLTGQSANMYEILRIANEHDLYVVEDAAQSHGADWKERMTGTMGDIGCFSFYPGKNLGAYGDGGATVTNDDRLAEKLRMLRNLGMKKKYHHEIFGWNSRLDSMQAAVLDVKLKYIDKWNARRALAAEKYCERLKDVKEIKLPAKHGEGKHVYHLFMIRTEKRDELLTYLSENSIGVGIHYPIPIHLTEAYSHLEKGPGSFPVTEKNSGTMLSLPMFPEISDQQIDYVVKQIKDFFA